MSLGFITEKLFDSLQYVFEITELAMGSEDGSFITVKDYSASSEYL
jgi:hypothetical protein